MTDNQDKRPTDSLDYEPVAKFQTDPKPEAVPAGPPDDLDPLLKITTGKR